MNARRPEPYIEAIESACSRYPDLIKLSRFLTRPQRFSGRAAVLEFKASSVERLNFENVDSLKMYLSGTAGLAKHRLFLLDDLSRPFVEALGTHFWMDPFFFAAHENSTHWTGTRLDYTLSRRLPSSQKLDQSFTLRYYEVVKTVSDDNRKDKRTLSNVERKIELGDLNHAFDGQQYRNAITYVVRRNASFWSRERKDGGWDALILIDPPVGDSVFNKNFERMSWPNKPYGFGYVDFTSWNYENASKMRQDSVSGPPRKSILDDIAWYWANVASTEQISGVKKDASLSSIFLKKIVASNWSILLEFVWAKLSEFERELGNFESKNLNYLGETLADINLFRRRLSWYYDEVEMSLTSVGIAVRGESNDEGKELLSILSRLQGYREKVESLTPIVTGMLNVRQADISMKETKLVSKLTLVALVFIPLSFTASIFSMGGSFLPGNTLFWVYFAVALPITLIILSLAWWLRGKSFI